MIPLDAEQRARRIIDGNCTCADGWRPSGASPSTNPECPRHGIDAPTLADLARDVLSLADTLETAERELADLARDVLSLADTLETAERERDEARETAVALGELAERQTRLIGRRMTFDDAMRAYARVIFDAAPDAPNCVEWGGDINGRPYALSIQWLDGKSPQTLLAEAMADRDAMQRDRDAARCALDGLAAAVTKEREARNVMNEADQDYEDGVESVEPYNAALAAWVPLDDAVAALLAAAPPRSTVPARVVRKYLAAADGYDPGCPGGCGIVKCCTREHVDATRAALDAALAGCS